VSTTSLRDGLSLHQRGRIVEAMAIYRAALAADPRQFDAHYLLGFAHLQRGELADAERLLGRAAEIDPRSVVALARHALALALMGRPAEAICAYDRALTLDPRMTEAIVGRGNAFMQLRKPQDALTCYNRALALDPDSADLLYRRANAASILGRYARATADCEALLKKSPFYPYARGVLVHSTISCCDWRGLDALKAEVSTDLSRGARSISPFNHKAISDSPEEQLLCARAWVKNECPPAPEPLWRGEAYAHARPRLAYVSADFGVTAMATLMAGVFERHDRSRFETVAISFGAHPRTPTRARLESAFERFVDVRGRSDSEISGLIRDLEIDIAVDLMGFTGECQTGIFARRAAPVQVNFLGFPGTMGAPYIDYIVADETVIPREDRAFYTEHVVYLPDCYQPNEWARDVAERTASRAELGLPEIGFVFCCFNNSFKIAPQIFDVWMRLLGAVPGSVLWLLADDRETVTNLKREARARGIDAGRLIFAPRTGFAEHLARYRLADLFLDTLPCNAHTTASDALRLGLPLVTCRGAAFAGRVAASVLQACGLSELVAASLAEYETLALRLACNEGALSAVRTKLAAAEQSPLFGTARFTRQLEFAYAAMHERQGQRLPPESFVVPPQ
jgi:predicted O-linked N-acetylglucosamine transferase (SPINDLY family)